MTAPAELDIAPPLDPKVAAERYQQTTAEATAALARMDAAVAAAEAELATAGSARPPSSWSANPARPSGAGAAQVGRELSLCWHQPVRRTGSPAAPRL